MIKDERIRIALAIVLYFGLVALFQFLGYLIADSQNRIGPNRISGALIIIGMGLLGLIIFCVVIVPLMKLKLNDYSPGRSSGVIFFVSFLIFAGIGCLLSIITDLYIPWSSSEDTAGQFLMWSGAMFGVITVFVFDSLDTQSESEAPINYMNSISSEAKENVKKLIKKEKKHKNIENIIITFFVCGCLFAFGYGLFTALSSETIYTANGSYSSALKDPFIVACLLALPLCCVAVPVYFHRKDSKVKSIGNGTIAVGVVHSCKLIIVNQPDNSYCQSMNPVYEVLVLVPHIDDFRRVTVTEKACVFVTNTQPPYETGDQVTITYNNTNPNHCQIIRKS